MNKIVPQILLLAVLPIFAFAKTQANEPTPLITNCADYLKEENLYSEINVVGKEDIKAGDTIDFNGSIINKNKYPLSDIGVFVKIAKKQSKEDIEENGPHVVDQFLVVKNRYIGGAKNSDSEKSKFSFSWKSPVNLENGEYQIYSYIIQNGSFLEDDRNIKNSSHFTIFSSNLKDLLFIEEGSIYVNENKYRDEIILGDDEGLNLSLSVKNNTNIKTEGYVVFKHYKNNIIDENNIINSEIQHFSLDSNKNKKLVFNSINSENNGFVVIELNYGDVKSIKNILLKNDNLGANIKTIGIKSFPIQKGNIVPVTVCFKTDKNAEENIKLRLLILNASSSPIYLNEVDIKSKEHAFGYVFPVKFYENLDSIKLTASLLIDGNVLTESTANYSCAFSERKDCSLSNSIMHNLNNGELDGSGKTAVIVITLFLLFITATYFIGHKKKTSPKEEHNIK